MCWKVFQCFWKKMTRHVRDRPHWLMWAPFYKKTLNVDLQVMCTFLLISWSSSWICVALRSCWCLRKRLLVASKSCNSFTFSSLFMAANLQKSEQQPILLNLSFFLIVKQWRCGVSCAFYFALCCVSFSSSCARMFLRCSSAFCSSSCVQIKVLQLSSLHFHYRFVQPQFQKNKDIM